MKNSVKIIKRILATSIVLLLSMNNFAAVVSDNDGSAFITKAEFDSLKADFDSQINQYNASIDNKIDGAIASYLSGINLEKEYYSDAIFKSFDESYITSVRANEVTFTEDLIRMNFRFGVGDSYASGGSQSNKVAYGNVKYTREANGKRGIVEKVGEGDDAIYLYKGWCDDYYNTYDCLIYFNNGPAVDSGYNNSKNGGLWGAWYNTINKTDRGGYEFTTSNWHLALNYKGEQNTYHSYAGTDMWGSWSFHEPISQKHNFIFKDDTTSGTNSSTYELRLTESMDKFIASNKAMWWDEWKKTNTTLYSGRYAVNGVNRSMYKESTDFTTSSWYYKEGAKSWTPISAPAFKNGTNWNNIYFNDKTNYDYKSKDGQKSLQYYKATGGIPLIIIENSETKVEWKLKFNESDPHKVYLKYEPFSNAVTESDCIDIYDNKEHTNPQKYITINEEGKIYFEADYPGIIFVKWCIDNDGGGTLDVAKSDQLVIIG